MRSLASAIAAHGIPTRHALPGAPVADDDFHQLLVVCEQHRLLGFLGFAVGAGAFPVTDEQRDAVEEQLGAWSAHALRVERLLLRTLDLLAARGIESRVLKGVALAHTAYPQPELRVFGDVDLLLPSARLLDAVDALTAGLGAERAQPELRPGFDERFGKEVMLRVGDHLELDLHRVFVEGPFGLTIRLDDLFSPPYRFPLAGYELEALPMPQRLLHACYAAVLGDWPPRLVALRDVAQLVVHEQPNLLDVLLMARAWRCEIVVARAISLAWCELEVDVRPPIVKWAEGFESSRVDRALLASYEGPARAFTRHLAALVVLHGLRDRVEYATAIAFPQRDYLRRRGFSGWEHVNRAWQGLRRGRAR